MIKNILVKEHLLVKGSKSSLAKILFMSLFLLPLAYWPWAPVPYELPRVWFVQRLVEVLGLLTLLTFRRIKPAGRMKLSYLVCLLGFLFSAVASAFWGVDAGKSLAGNYFRGDGLLTLFHLLGLAFFVSLYYREVWREASAKAISLGAAAVSLWAVLVWLILHTLKYPVSNWEGKIAASFGQPLFLAGYLVVALPFSAYLLAQSQKLPQRLFWGAALIVQILAIVQTRSLGGLLGVGLFLSGVLGWQRKISRRVQLVLVLLVLASVFSLFYLRSSSRGESAESRERIWRKVFLGGLQRPILGWGWANVDYAFENVDWPFHYNIDVYVDKAHSTILEVFATTGVVGSFWYLTLLILTLRTLAIRRQHVLLLSFILYIVHTQTNIISIAEEVIFWLIVGISATEHSRDRGSGNLELTGVYGA